MCGRYTLRRVDRIRTAFQAGLPESFEEFSELKIVPRFNIAPSQHVPIIRLNARAERVISVVRWGLIPSWTKDKPRIQPINSRAETVATSGMTRQAFNRRRCLVPADGFYEWQKIGDRKQPMFTHRQDHESFAFAGVWERWKPGPDDKPVDTMSIITTTPNGLMSPIHDRMPVILSDGDYARWLDRETPGADVAALLKPYDGGEFIAEPVSTLVNSPKNDHESCVCPLTDD